jgi:hypothetical protein
MTNSGVMGMPNAGAIAMPVKNGSGPADSFHFAMRPCSQASQATAANTTTPPMASRRFPHGRRALARRLPTDPEIASAMTTS